VPRRCFVDFEIESLEIELRELGATAVQRQVLVANVERARAAIAEAYTRGAGKPLYYALSLFNSDTFQPERKRKPKPVNRHGREDPLFTDDGERIWQAHEVTDEWRHGHLVDCVKGLSEGYDPLARYQPSEEEMEAWVQAMRLRVDVLRIGPRHIRRTSQVALDAWAEVWSFDDLRLDQAEDDPEPVLEDDPEPVLA
jgi:hypothetical protein